MKIEEKMKQEEREAFRRKIEEEKKKRGWRSKMKATSKTEIAKKIR